MDQVAHTSFIPRQPFVRKADGQRSGMSLVTLVSLLIFILSVLVLGISFGYKTLLNNKIHAKCPSEDPRSPYGCGLDASIERARNDIDRNLLLRFRRIDAKLKAAGTLLSNHVTSNLFFEDLGINTLKTIRYTKFAYKDFSVSLDGVAAGYEDIALQSSALAKLSGIKSFIFSDFNLNDRGQVTFKLSLALNPVAVSYREYLGRQTSSVLPTNE